MSPILTPPGGGNSRRQQGQSNEQVTLNVDPQDLPDVTCKCGGKFFYAPGTVVGIKKVSRLISPDMKEGNLAYPATVCVKCGEALEDEALAP